MNSPNYTYHEDTPSGVKAFSTESKSFSPQSIWRLLIYALTFRVSKAQRLTSFDSKTLHLALAVMFGASLLLSFPQFIETVSQTQQNPSAWLQPNFVTAFSTVRLAFESVLLLVGIFIVNLIITIFFFPRHCKVPRFRAITYSTSFSLLFAFTVLLFTQLLNLVFKIFLPFSSVTEVIASEENGVINFFGLVVLFANILGFTIAIAVALSLYTSLISPVTKNPTSFSASYTTVLAALVIAVLFVIALGFYYLGHIMVGTDSFFTL